MAASQKTVTPQTTRVIVVDWSPFLPTLLATLGGVVAGVPIGLYVDRRGRANERRVRRLELLPSLIDILHEQPRALEANWLSVPEGGNNISLDVGVPLLAGTGWAVPSMMALFEATPLRSRLSDHFTLCDELVRFSQQSTTIWLNAASDSIGSQGLDRYQGFLNYYNENAWSRQKDLARRLCDSAALLESELVELRDKHR